MALPNADTMRIAYWIAWQREHGLDADETLAAFQRRFPDRPISQYSQANKFAGRMMRVGAAVGNLRQEQQLREALGRGAEPNPLVGVAVLFHWQDAHGREFWNTVKVMASWETTIADVRAEANRLIAETMGRYPGGEIHTAEIIPKVLWPFPEQL